MKMTDYRWNMISEWNGLMTPENVERVPCVGHVCTPGNHLRIHPKQNKQNYMWKLWLERDMSLY